VPNGSASAKGSKTAVENDIIESVCPSAARTRGWDIFWISRVSERLGSPRSRPASLASFRRPRAVRELPTSGPGLLDRNGGGRCRHRMFARSSAPSNEFRTYNPNQITVRALLQLWMSGSQRIAARRPRIADGRRSEPTSRHGSASQPSGPNSRKPCRLEERSGAPKASIRNIWTLRPPEENSP
jgi:hypothetical protein